MKEQLIIDKGKHKCFFCDSMLDHINTDMATDVYPDLKDEDEIILYLSCPNCGAEYEVIKPSNCDDI